jgi:glycosyltransferase involved in cell wall biosynthesis
MTLIEMRKLALISHILPPSPSGQAIMLYRLLRDWDARDYCLLSRNDYRLWKGVQGQLLRLKARYYHLKPHLFLRALNQFKILEPVNLLLQTIQRARNIARIVKREGCRIIIACSGDLLDLPAGYLASRLMRVPFYAYIFDDYLYQWTKPIHRYLARRVEPIMLKRATAVIVSNEFLSDEYYRRYGIQPKVIHNPCENFHIIKKTNIPWPSCNDEIKIVYTGAIYHVHFDAFINIIAAINLLGRSDIRLHLYTAQPRAELERENICGPIIYHNHLSPLQLFDVQKRADILFLPLAFNSKVPEVIRTSAPGKMGEYMASGRPILVHAPADSFISWYFREYKCGLVVDKSNLKNLSQAISRIFNDSKLRQKLMVNAKTRAKADFNLHAAQDKFLKLFQLQKGN